MSRGRNIRCGVCLGSLFLRFFSGFFCFLFELILIVGRIKIIVIRLKIKFLCDRVGLSPDQCRDSNSNGSDSSNACNQRNPETFFHGYHPFCGRPPVGGRIIIIYPLSATG